MSKGFDIGGLFRQAQQLQEKLASVQQEIGARTVEASAGGGMVTAVINGKLELVQIRIEPSLLESPDVEMLQDLVVAAVNEAMEKSKEMASTKMQSMAAGLGLPPGLV